MIGASGERTVSFSMMPIIFMAVFTGIGFDSMKLPVISGRTRLWISRAPSQSSLSAAATMALIRRGISLPATEITPSPPHEIIGSVQASSPLRTRKPSSRSRRIVRICSMFADASLTPMTFGTSRPICSVVAAVMLTPVRPGTL